MPHRIASIVAARLGWVKVQGDLHWVDADGGLRDVATWLPSVNASHAFEALSCLPPARHQWYWTIERTPTGYKASVWRSETNCWKAKSRHGAVEERTLPEAICRAILIATTPRA